MAEDDIKLMDTGDGSHTLINTTLDETYHSRHGALRESKHVFLKEGLSHWLNTQNLADSIAIFEMGLGTGLNLILTLKVAIDHPHLQFSYQTLEAYPLSDHIIDSLNYPELINDEKLDRLFKVLHQSPWGEWVNLLPNFKLYKAHQKLEDFEVIPERIDLIYYDAFAPNKQAELWTYETIQKVCSLLKTNGVFVTYCAKGQLKRDLKALNLQVETLPGPPGKAEMVRATKLKAASL